METKGSYCICCGPIHRIPVDAEGQHYQLMSIRDGMGEKGEDVFIVAKDCPYEKIQREMFPGDFQVLFTTEDLELVRWPDQDHPQEQYVELRQRVDDVRVANLYGGGDQ